MTLCEEDFLDQPVVLMPCVMRAFLDHPVVDIVQYHEPFSVMRAFFDQPVVAVVQYHDPV
jgi:hypothetical protein